MEIDGLPKYVRSVAVSSICRPSSRSGDASLSKSRSQLDEASRIDDSNYRKEAPKEAS